MLPELKQLSNMIRTTLQALEEGMPWANKAELYIKLMKEAVRKDMQVANSLLAFYVERHAQIYNMTVLLSGTHCMLPLQPGSPE